MNNMIVFVRVVERGSFTAAASILNCSTSSISKRVNQLEHEVGAKLLNRSTHSVLSLTEAGEIFFDRARQIIRDLEGAKEAVLETVHAVHGTLKIHMTPGTGLKIALPAVLEFMKMHPQLVVEISIQPEAVDILRMGYDISVRSGSAGEINMLPVGVEAYELSMAKYVIYGSQAYFDAHGRPGHPSELVNHNCLISARQHSPNQWWFRDGEQEFSVQVSGNVVADNWTVIHDAVRAGIGIARILQVSPLMRNFDDLEPIFADMTANDRALWALTPRMRPVPRKVKLLLDFLRLRLNQGENQAPAES